MVYRLCLLALATALALTAQSPQLRSGDGKNKYLGNLNENRYDPNSVANPYGKYGSKYSPDSINNPYGEYGSRYSPKSATNPYASHPPKVVTPDGKYLGKYTADRFDPESVSNPLGKHGNKLNPDSINNRLGRYGSPYTPEGVRNPFGRGKPGAGKAKAAEPKSRPDPFADLDW